MNLRKVLVSGGAGFIGSRLALRLTELGHEVTVLDNLSEQVHGPTSPLFELIRHRTNFIKGDVRSRDDWRSSLKDQDAVVHLAAETGTGQSMYEIDRYVDVNVRGTALLLDLLANESHRVKKILVASSRSIYGEGKAECLNCEVVYPKERGDMHMKAGDFEVKCPICSNSVNKLPTDECSQLHPSSIYGITKLSQEQLVLTAGQALGIPSCALRYQNVYGPGQSLSNPYTGILSIFSTRIRNGNGLNIFEDGRESRDFVYIDDVIAATVETLTSDAANGLALNVGSGVPTDVVTVAKTLCAAYGIDVPIEITGNYRLGDIRHNYADLSLVGKMIGFVPRVSFAEGASRFAQWVSGQKVGSDAYEKSLQEMRSRGLLGSAR